MSGLKVVFGAAVRYAGITDVRWTWLELKHVDKCHLCSDINIEAAVQAIRTNALSHPVVVSARLNCNRKSTDCESQY